MGCPESMQDVVESSCESACAIELGPYAPGKIAHVELQIVTHDTQATLRNLHVVQCRLGAEVWTLHDPDHI